MLSKTIILSTLLSSATSALAAFSIPAGICDLNTPGYTGGWFEIAASQNVARTIESGCECPVAYYTLNSTNPDNIDITNSCIRNGSFWKMQGSARPVQNPNATSANLNVHFDGSATSVSDTWNGNYVVLKTWSDEFSDYTDAVVGGKNANTWWILSRSPFTTGETFSEGLDLLRSWNYTVDNYRLAVQDCVFSGGHDGVNLKKPSA